MTTLKTAHTVRQAEDIVDALPLAQQIGLLLHPMIVLNPDPDASSGFGGPSMRELIVDHGIRFFCLGPLPEPAAAARIIGDLQEIARESGSALPLVFSTDPRHAFMQTDGAAHAAKGVSQWPENIGLGALGDVDLVRRYADIVRRDYLAMGIRMALHPQVDLATEPRWARQAQSFGSDSEHTIPLLLAFLEGLQGPSLGPSGVAATVKHFPGGGPQLDGEDPHFPYGREQVYPGGRFEEHLAPFRAAVAAGAAAIMPYYGMPVNLVLDGEPVDPVGFAFNRRIITELLREQLGFDGVVLSDFGLVTDIEIAGKPFPARAWGVEHLDETQRVGRLFQAGVDQLGGERNPRLITAALESGLLSVERIRESAVRIVRMMLDLGIVPGAERAAIDSTHGADLPDPAHVELGETAQSRAMTVLRNASNDSPAELPLARSLAAHLVNVASDALPPGWRVAPPEKADIAIVRLRAPFEHRDEYFLEAGMHQGSLEFSDEHVAQVAELAAAVPVVLVVEMNRPAVLTPLLEHAHTIVADFGASDAAVFRALLGDVNPEGRLPFELPFSMDAVRVSAPDVANDTVAPLFPVGWQVAIASDRDGRVEA
ncbi:glycoside hydrolase family 3 N-terminal domain-containing protein [Microbacterium sp. ET2]|uniref:glycoside hydrolase family 3 protein n=1 Tax=Microbacterium albipurpureum TaxID=3050384 RepID=UPI00259CB183|nr:glycoside hydrolase family 3 N-terminal domain-containing protein [Microbacterium sp. ET2 (Ac-2212)]WJL96949.1 glycoside hydrolase family 3 N-terminal domain-containing protein [Microbacterium sp. ET2 (Ac-2212)]